MKTFRSAIFWGHLVVGAAAGLVVLIMSVTGVALSAGRRARSWLRFAHTGEFYGLTGQTIAGLASLGGAFLVYTGLSLALRGLAAWLKRRRAAEEYEQPRAA